MERDEDVIARLATEFADLPPMELILRPETVMSLVGVVQLALRHPEFTEGATHAAALRFIDGARSYFAACPTALDVVRRGDDPREDR